MGGQTPKKSETSRHISTVSGRGEEGAGRRGETHDGGVLDGSEETNLVDRILTLLLREKDGEGGGNT